MGGSHPYTYSSETRISYWGLFGGEKYSNSVNSYEKELLGWITVPEIKSDTTVILNDFLTTNQAVKYKVPTQNGSNEYFYFENHQFAQTTTGIDVTFDQPTYNLTDKGVFVLHVQEPYLSSINNSLSSKVSGGNWDWINTGWAPEGCGWTKDDYPIFKKDKSNPFGASVREPIDLVTSPKSGRNFLADLRFKEGKPQFNCAKFMLGVDDEDKMAFTKEYRPLLAIHTNPNNSNRLGEVNNFAMKVENQSGTKMTLKFFTNYNPYSIIENTTWDGQIFLDDNVTVQSGKTLTIKPNTTVYVANGKSISVNGILNADGVIFTAWIAIGEESIFTLEAKVL